jgi:hypothetical protein
LRWWRFAAGGALLLWVLGTAYRQARMRGRELSLAVVLVGVAAFMFAAGALMPRPPLSAEAGSVLVVGSIAVLAAAMAVLLWRGFRE